MSDMSCKSESDMNDYRLLLLLLSANKALNLLSVEPTEVRKFKKKFIWQSLSTSLNQKWFQSVIDPRLNEGQHGWQFRCQRSSTDTCSRVEVNENYTGCEAYLSSLLSPPRLISPLYLPLMEADIRCSAQKWKSRFSSYCFFFFLFFFVGVVPELISYLILQQNPWYFTIFYLFIFVLQLSKRVTLLHRGERSFSWLSVLLKDTSEGWNPAI